MGKPWMRQVTLGRGSKEDHWKRMSELRLELEDKYCRPRGKNLPLIPGFSNLVKEKILATDHCPSSNQLSACRFQPNETDQPWGWFF